MEMKIKIECDNINVVVSKKQRFDSPHLEIIH